jgi:predicted metal-dependent HD superfamily phosphohydrolase
VKLAEANGDDTTPPVEAWRRAWGALGVREPDASLLDELLHRYAEPHRRYHTMQHLGECFAQFAVLRDVAEHPEEIELALWFHDAIYDTHRDDNEQRSADWARSSVLAAGAPSAAADRVHALVMATRHDALPATDGERILVDVDLSILGADPQRFDEYEEQVRCEYAWVCDAAFRSGRRSILEAFLSRPRLYATERFAALYEARARSNLRRSVERLAEGPP